MLSWIKNVTSEFALKRHPDRLDGYERPAAKQWQRDQAESHNRLPFASARESRKGASELVIEFLVFRRAVNRDDFGFVDDEARARNQRKRTDEGVRNALVEHRQDKGDTTRRKASGRKHQR